MAQKNIEAELQYMKKYYDPNATAPPKKTVKVKVQEQDKTQVKMTAQAVFSYVPSTR